MSGKPGVIDGDVLDCIFQTTAAMTTIGRVTLGCDLTWNSWLLGVVFYRNMTCAHIGPVCFWVYFRRGK